MYHWACLRLLGLVARKQQFSPSPPDNPHSKDDRVQVWGEGLWRCGRIPEQTKSVRCWPRWCYYHRSLLSLFIPRLHPERSRSRSRNRSRSWTERSWSIRRLPAHAAGKDCPARKKFPADAAAADGSGIAKPSVSAGHSPSNSRMEGKRSAIGRLEALGVWSCLELGVFLVPAGDRLDGGDYRHAPRSRGDWGVKSGVGLRRAGGGKKPAVSACLRRMAAPRAGKTAFLLLVSTCLQKEMK